jgi:hypothetical protein
MGACAIFWIKYSIPFQRFTVVQEKFLQKTKAENKLAVLPRKTEYKDRNYYEKFNVKQWHD